MLTRLPRGRTSFCFRLFENARLRFWPCTSVASRLICLQSVFDHPNPPSQESLGRSISKADMPIGTGQCASRATNQSAQQCSRWTLQPMRVALRMHPTQARPEPHRDVAYRHSDDSSMLDHDLHFQLLSGLWLSGFLTRNSYAPHLRERHNCGSA
jgi:hypothetical protein